MLPRFIFLTTSHCVLSSGLTIVTRLFISASFAVMPEIIFVPGGLAVSFGVPLGCGALGWSALSVPCQLLDDIEDFGIILLKVCYCVSDLLVCSYQLLDYRISRFIRSHGL